MSRPATLRARPRRHRAVEQPIEDLRAQYLAASYLVSASEQALHRMRALCEAAEGRGEAPRLALSLMTDIHADWSTALQHIATQLSDHP